MRIIINLSGLKTKEEILHKFGEVFEFGGPDGNIPVKSPDQGNGWGFNWDAMNDSFRSLEEGGIWGTSKKFTFPLKIEISNYNKFKENDSESFRILKEILDDQIKGYKQEGKVVEVVFS